MYMSSTHTDSCRVIQPFTVVGGTKTLLFPQYWSVVFIISMNTSFSQNCLLLSVCLIFFCISVV